MAFWKDFPPLEIMSVASRGSPCTGFQATAAPHPDLRKVRFSPVPDLPEPGVLTGDSFSPDAPADPQPPTGAGFAPRPLREHRSPPQRSHSDLTRDRWAPSLAQEHAAPLQTPTRPRAGLVVSGKDGRGSHFMSYLSRAVGMSANETTGNSWPSDASPPLCAAHGRGAPRHTGALAVARAQPSEPAGPCPPTAQASPRSLFSSGRTLSPECRGGAGEVTRPCTRSSKAGAGRPASTGHQQPALTRQTAAVLAPVLCGGLNPNFKITCI